MTTSTSGIPRQRGQSLRALVVAVVGLLATALVVAVCWRLALTTLETVQAPGPQDPADLLILALTVAGGALAAWLGLGIVVSALAGLPGALGRVSGSLADRVAPALVRRGAALMIGTALTAVVVPAAQASPGHTGLAHTGVTTSISAQVVPAPDPDGLPLPSATSSASPTLPADPDTGATGGAGAPSAGPAYRPPTQLGPLAPAAPRQRADVVTVVRGDSLWAIAARHLGPDATPAAIAAEWPRWYAANKTVIGTDPDLILVGQQLTPPAAAPATSTSGAAVTGGAS